MHNVASDVFVKMQLFCF